MSKQLNLEEVLAILDANDEFKAEDHPGFNLEDWQYTSAETDYYDFEEDYLYLLNLLISNFYFSLELDNLCI